MEKRQDKFYWNSLYVYTLLAGIWLLSCQPPQLSTDRPDYVLPDSSGYDFSSGTAIDTSWAVHKKTSLAGMPAGEFLHTFDQLFATTYNGFLIDIRLPGLDKKHSKKLAEGLSCPPVISGKILYCGAEIGKYNLIAYELNKGKILWTKTASPVVSVVAHSGLVIAAQRDGLITAYAGTSGIRQWQTELGQTISQPLLVLPGRVIAVSDKGRLRAIDPVQGRILWEFDLVKSILTRLSLSGNDLFVAAFDGTLFKFDPEHGRLQAEIRFPAAFYQPVSINREAVFAATADSRLYRLERQTLRILWQSELKSPLTIPLYCFSDFLITADAAARLLFIDPKNGALVKSFAVDGRLRTAPVLFGDYLLFGMEYNRIIQFRKATL